MHTLCNVRWACRFAGPAPRAWERRYNSGILAPSLALCQQEPVISSYLSTMANVTTNYDYFFKVLLCGDSGVGKTSMLCRFINDEMEDAYIATVG